MALPAQVHHFEIALSDVDRGVYESLDLRVARHPSESMRYLVLRTLAYALSYEEGIAFSKAGLSSADEAPISIRDATGLLVAWIDIGSPSAERLHKAAKAAQRVLVFTSGSVTALRKEAASRPIHRLDEIEVWSFDADFVSAVEGKIERHAKLEITRNDGQIYVVIGGETLETPLERVSLA